LSGGIVQLSSFVVDVEAQVENPGGPTPIPNQEIFATPL
jgi:hypothetical protein